MVSATGGAGGGGGGLTTGSGSFESRCETNHNPTAAAAPFGGAKHSGIGREGGREGIAEYLETKLGGFSI